MISTSLCLFARLPLEVWRQLVGLLSFSDVAACSCSTSHEDTKWLLTGYMRRRCCVSTFKRLLAHYGAIIWDPDYGEKWDTHFWNGDFMRKEFWRLAIEMIFLYEPKMLQEGQRCDRLIQQDYIHSCGILFACEADVAEHAKLFDKMPQERTKQIPKTKKQKRALDPSKWSSRQSKMLGFEKIFFSQTKRTPTK